MPNPFHHLAGRARLLCLPALASLLASAVHGADLHPAAIERLTGLRGTMNTNEGVFKVTVPRNDLKISVGGWTMPPFMGLTSWAAFSEGKKAEHNALIELSGDPTQSTWKTDTDVFEDKKHLTRSAMQLTLVQLSKLTLTEAIKRAEAAQPGTVYSITPAVKDGNPVFNVKVANAEGKSTNVVVDAKTGEASK